MSNPAAVQDNTPVRIVADPSSPIGAALVPVRDAQQRAVQQVQREDPLLAAVAALSQIMSLANMMVKSGFMPRAVKTAEQAAAIMLTGREMGIGPMLSIRSINIVDARPVVAADLQLAQFKKDGGSAVFCALTDQEAVLWLRHPNGDEHTESFTHADAAAALLLGKDNWKKHKKAMLRSRVITAALKSIGYESMAGVYDPDEAEAFTDARGSEPSTRPVQQMTATVTADAVTDAGTDTDAVTQDGPVHGERDGAAWSAPSGIGPSFPYGPLKGTPLNARYDAEAVRARKKRGTDEVMQDAVGGFYVCNDARLGEAIDWAIGKLDLDLAAREKQPKSEEKHIVTDEQRAFLNTIVQDCGDELKAREAEHGRAQNAAAAAEDAPAGVK